MATEAFDFGAPADPDEADSAVNLGVVWATLAEGSWVGNRIRLPTSAPGITTTATAYDDDTGAELATKVFTPTPLGGLVDALFDTAVDIVPGVNYLAAWHTDRYTFTSAYGWPATTENLFTLPSSAARFLYSASVGRPINGSSATYHVSPLVSFGGEVVQAAVAFTAAGTLLAAPRAIATGAAALTAAANLAAVPRAVAQASASLAAAGGLAVTPRVVRRATVALVAAGRLNVTLPADLVKPGVLTPGAATAALLTPGAAAARLEAT